MSTRFETLRPHNQFRGSDNAVSWRHQQVNISGHGLKTINFSDTTPNMFMVQNPSAATLHIGISNIPTADSYEFRVNPNSSKTFGRPIQTTELFLLNMSNADITINLYSVLDVFDLGLMQDSTVTIEEGALKEIKGDGLVKGFAPGVGLPYGVNYLGKVDIDHVSDFGDTAKDYLSGLTAQLVDSMTNGFSEIKTILSNLNSGGGSATQTNKFFKSVTITARGSNALIPNDMREYGYNHIEYIANNSNIPWRIGIYGSDPYNTAEIWLQPGDSLQNISFDADTITAASNIDSFDYNGVVMTGSVDILYTMRG